MTRIDSISPKPDRAGKYRIKLSDGTNLALYRQTVEDFRLFPGMELREEQLTEIRQSAGAYSAKMRAVRIVSASAVSREDLEQRLVRKGEAPEQAKAAVEWMEELHLVDDAATARQVVEGCVRKGYGLSRAKQALYEKRIPKEFWEDALADYPDQTEHIVKFLRSKVTDPADPKQVRRAVDGLLRRGHNYGAIRHGLELLGTDADECMEEYE